MRVIVGAARQVVGLSRSGTGWWSFVVYMPKRRTAPALRIAPPSDRSSVYSPVRLGALTASSTGVSADVWTCSCSPSVASEPMLAHSVNQAGGCLRHRATSLPPGQRRIRSPEPVTTRISGGAVDIGGRSTLPSSGGEGLAERKRPCRFTGKQLLSGDRDGAGFTNRCIRQRNVRDAPETGPAPKAFSGSLAEGLLPAPAREDRAGPAESFAAQQILRLPVALEHLLMRLCGSLLHGNASFLKFQHLLACTVIRTFPSPVRESSTHSGRSCNCRANPRTSVNDGSSAARPPPLRCW